MSCDYGAAKLVVTVGITVWKNLVRCIKNGKNDVATGEAARNVLRL